MTRATNDAQETGLLIALLAARTRHENPTHRNNLIDPDTAQTALDTIGNSLRGAEINSVIAAIEGAANYEITRRPIAEPYTGNPDQWAAWPGFEDGCEDFALIAAGAQHDEQRPFAECPTAAKTLANKREQLATMGVTHRTGYLMGVLSAASRHFNPPAF
ncbi:hypothetical protein [Nocardioides sp. GCM10030258]|uniref:hypothetical protein n=1 Tax=unclassified Nocardioides TaxID=2615069 RepID=UPI0036242A03